jgi:hypothetical protein
MSETDLEWITIASTHAVALTFSLDGLSKAHVRDTCSYNLMLVD